MEEKILQSIKQMLGIPDAHTAFDFELKMHINSAVATLTQLGVGPENGLEVSDTTPWSALLQDKQKLSMANSYLFLKVKMLFDSAQMTAHVVRAYEEQIKELGERLQMAADPMTPWAPVEPVEEVY